MLFCEASCSVLGSQSNQDVLIHFCLWAALNHSSYEACHYYIVPSVLLYLKCRCFVLSLVMTTSGALEHASDPVAMLQSHAHPNPRRCFAHHAVRLAYPRCCNTGWHVHYDNRGYIMRACETAGVTMCFINYCHCLTIVEQAWIMSLEFLAKQDMQ